MDSGDFGVPGKRRSKDSTQSYRHGDAGDSSHYSFLQIKRKEALCKRTRQDAEFPGDDLPVFSKPGGRYDRP